MTGAEQAEHDREVRCANCHAAFVVTGNERRWLRSMNFADPRHCLPCRRVRRRARAMVEGGDRLAGRFE